MWQRCDSAGERSVIRVVAILVSVQHVGEQVPIDDPWQDDSGAVGNMPVSREEVGTPCRSRM